MRAKPMPTSRFETGLRQTNRQLTSSPAFLPAVSFGKEQDHFDSVASRGCLTGFAIFASENFQANGNTILKSGSHFTNQSEFSSEPFEVSRASRVPHPARLRGVGTGYEMGHRRQILRRVWWRRSSESRKVMKSSALSWLLKVGRQPFRNTIHDCWSLPVSHRIFLRAAGN